jgi:type VI secretion system secreted protein VgrG
MAFIQRIAAAEGIWFRFEHAEDREVIVFSDDFDAYASSPRTVPLHSDTGLESVARGDKTTNAVDSCWGDHYETPEEGQRIAQLRHEAHLAPQITFEGKGNVFALEVGEVLRLDRNPVDAPHGLFVVSVESSEGRIQAYSNTFSAIPSDRVWRTPLEPGAQPVISCILPARVTSLRDYTRAYLTPEGWYVMPLPCDLDACSSGGTSRPVRLAKPYRVVQTDLCLSGPCPTACTPIWSTT